MIKGYQAVFILLTLSAFLLANAQTIPISSYTQLSNYATNPYFQVVNQTLSKAYSSYLAQTTVTSVYSYNSNSLVSIIITYTNRAGASYRGTANYIPSTRQLSVQSFGPVASQRNTVTSSTPSQMNIYEQENGIGIISASSPPGSASNLIPGTNPSVKNQQISVLLSNSTTTRSPTSTSSSSTDPDEDTRDTYGSSTLSSYSSYSSRYRS